jgi:heme-degrading monooxygenase HmoA
MFTLVTLGNGAFAVHPCRVAHKSGQESFCMPYVMIQHKVANYAKWKWAVKAFAKVRKASGEKSLHVCRSSKGPNDLLVWCEWDTAARMKKFIKSADLRKAMAEAGVSSKPAISFYSAMEDLSVG